ncbi:MAG: biotin--[acetyl-CoA-carboxylase] ligase [Candidatus Dormibacteria bacterium]
MTNRLDMERLRRVLPAAQLTFSPRLYAQVGSTQDLARDGARAGAPEGLVIFADQQLAGRGRAGRSWLAPPGSALMFSLLLRPPAELWPWSTLPLVAGLAVVEGIAEAGGPRALLKWPNDCLCGERKLAGILAEACSERGRVTGLVLGVGCNLAWKGVEPGPELLGLATACDLEGHPVDPTELAEAILLRLAARYVGWVAQGFGPLRREWLEHAAWLGREVVASHPSGRVRGRLLDLSQQGELIVETASGRVAISAGEVEAVGVPALRLDSPGTDDPDPP